MWHVLNKFHFTQVCSNTPTSLLFKYPECRYWRFRLLRLQIKLNIIHLFIFGNHHRKELRYIHNKRCATVNVYLLFKTNCDIFCCLHPSTPIPKSRPFISCPSLAGVDEVQEMPHGNGRCNLVAKFLKN